MNNDIFQFRILNLSYGWCRVKMIINDKEVNSNANYLESNPLASFIDACAEFLVNEYDDEYHITWQAEPGKLEFKLRLDNQDLLHLDLTEMNEDEKTIYGDWHETVSFQAFLSSVVSEGFRVLNAFCLYGYYCSWSDHIDFPLPRLLRITEKIKAFERDDCDSYLTDLSKELDCIHTHLLKWK